MALANTEPFSIHLIGDVTGETWTGDFTTKIWLSHRELLRMDAVRRQLLGETQSAPSDRALQTADMISELTIRLVDPPPFWRDNGNGLDLLDDNVLTTVWGKVQEIVGKAVEARTKQAKAVQEKLRQEAKTKAEAEKDDK